MNAVPARVAGVERIVIVVPPTGGEIDPLVLVAADIAGVSEIYRVGGAQAVAALAYGTETIRPVVKIVGPGNAYVAVAKRQVFGQVGIDSIAGPSEVLIIADKENDPEWIAADLIAQAEHGMGNQTILITDDEVWGGVSRRPSSARSRHCPIRRMPPRAGVSLEPSSWWSGWMTPCHWPTVSPPNMSNLPSTTRRPFSPRCAMPAPFSSAATPRSHRRLCRRL